MRTRLHRVLTAAVLAGIASFSAMTAAHANEYTCDSGEICLWENEYRNVKPGAGDYSTFGFKGRSISDLSYGNNEWRDAEVKSHDGTDNMNDETSSVLNNSSCTVVLYAKDDYEGDSLALGAGDYANFLSDEKIGDNEASSHKFIC
ncbi:peptidase inhibitor family I36 protein [Streptomyces sp. TS71-3]|uniref:peptidase inhibitor family I36 protein n=1 Tax=Streptomyces sp. TS71-3 TaxID=2733862 RepID=UPI001B2EB407|nr:peptidase inhibitor family I36 protein [Streptomyces sp. TS71-3]GHJ39436.1 hypothetical protein Sm713_50450 [Streptomyces sp. TS71-3]